MPEAVQTASASFGLVGREAELGELTAGLGDAYAGRAGLFLIQGEPGIGKSRLADELAAVARAGGAHVLVGRCWEAGGAPAYWPWTQSLRTYIRQAEPGVVRRQLGGGMADLAQVVPELRELLPELLARESPESDAARFRLFDSTASFLRNAAVETPLVLVLDDLHAADEPSLLLLRYVASELGDARILIVGTFRDLDPTVQDPLESTLAELARAPVTRRIRLSGLSEPEVGRLAELTAQTEPPEHLVAELYAETEGNPLFVSEIVRLLAAEGRLGLERPERIPIPETVREAIGRRLRHLSGECRRVLSLASVFGRDFGLVALERVADYTGIDRLLSVLDEAITARAVEEIPGTIGRLRFGHALTRDSLYEEIPATHRARLHRRVAEVLEDLYAGNPEPHLTELAHHFSLAVPAAAPEKAVEYATRAGDGALAALAYEEAARLYELALDNLQLAASGDEQRRCRLLLANGEAHIRAGNTAIAKEAFLNAAADARRFGGSRELARAAIGYGGRIIWARAGDDDRLVPLLEEALEALEPEEAELRARLLARLSGALRDEHSRSRRDDVSSEAVDLARRSGNPSALAYALDARASAIVAPDTIEECTSLANELAEVAARIDEPERVVAAHHHLLIARLLVGDVRAGAEHAAAIRIADELKQPAQLWQARANEALLALADGRFAEAEQLIVDALSIGEAAQPGAAIPINRLHRYALADARGHVEELEQEVLDLVEQFPARPVFRCVLAHLYARSGRAEAASREFDAFARDDFSVLPFDQEWLFGMSFLAETAALLSASDAAAVLYDQLLPWAALNAVDVGEGFRGSVSRYLGLLAAMLGRHDDAVSHYRAAVEMNERMGGRPWLAHAQEEYARTLVARAAPGDAERAEALLQQATSTYEELGMQRETRIM
jgi:tetratricopeptide (TPR) repeat protein